MGLGSSTATKAPAVDVDVEKVNTDGTSAEVATEATTEGKPAKRPARKQVKHPLLFDADGNPQKLKEMPADYSLKDHKPLIRKDFEDETIWLEWRADFYEEKAKGYRDEAALIRQFGSAEDRKAAEKLIKVRAQFEKLKAELAGQDIDVEGILAGVLGEAEAETPKEVAEAVMEDIAEQTQENEAEAAE